MQTIGAVLPELHPQVFAWLTGRDVLPVWLAERDVPPVGLPFWKYNVIDMEQEMEVEVGAPSTSSTPRAATAGRPVWKSTRPTPILT